MVLGNLAKTADVRSHLRLMQNRCQIHAFGLPMIDGLFRLDNIRAADHFVDRTESKLSHDLASFLGNKIHKVHHVLRVTGKFFPEFRILRRHTDGTRVEVAHTHHDAAQSH